MLRILSQGAHLTRKKCGLKKKIKFAKETLSNTNAGNNVRIIDRIRV